MSSVLGTEPMLEISTQFGSEIVFYVICHFVHFVLIKNVRLCSPKLEAASNFQSKICSEYQDPANVLVLEITEKRE